MCATRTERPQIGASIKIELKAIQHNARASEETYSYSAKLFVDGNHIADVSNGGTGGADRIWPAKGVTHADIAAIEQRVKAEYPKEKLFEDSDTLYEQTLESVCHGLVSDFLELKRLKRLLTTSVICFENGLPAPDATAPLVSYKINPAKGATTDRIRTLLREKHPGAYILNDVSPEDALIAFKRMG